MKRYKYPLLLTFMLLMLLGVYTNCGQNQEFLSNVSSQLKGTGEGGELGNLGDLRISENDEDVFELDFSIESVQKHSFLIKVSVESAALVHVYVDGQAMVSDKSIEKTGYITIDSLSPTQAYDVQVIAEDKASSQQNSQTQVITTLADYVAPLHPWMGSDCQLDGGDYTELKVLAGNKDNFVGREFDALPTSGFVSFESILQNKTFDETQNNMPLHASINLSAYKGSIACISVQAHVQYLDDQVSTDSVAFYAFDEADAVNGLVLVDNSCTNDSDVYCYSERLQNSSSFIQNPGHEIFTHNYDLSQVQSQAGEDMIEGINQHGFLHFYAQDDTAFDYVEVTMMVKNQILQ